MMTNIFQAFKGLSSTLSSSVPQTTLAIIEGPANVRGENVIQADTKEPPSHTKGRMMTCKLKKIKLEKNKSLKEQQKQNEKIGLDPKTIISAKAGEKFKKASHTSSPQERAFTKG
ncbi:hypothetical protein Tco_0950815 [Tanacetum coccineum]